MVVRVCGEARGPTDHRPRLFVGREGPTSGWATERDGNEERRGSGAVENDGARSTTNGHRNLARVVGESVWVRRDRWENGPK